MIDKTIGVIPPRSEQNSFPEKKVENSKNKKSEFESLLSQSSRQSKKPDKKEKSDQALGGTKKKVQDTDQKLADQSEKTKKSNNETEKEGVEGKKKQKIVNEEMVLGSMASIESANKTPDSEVNPDNLEKTNLSTTVVAQALAPEEVVTPAPEMNQISDEALASLFEVQQPMEVPSEDVMSEEVSSPVVAHPVVEAKTTTETVNTLLNQLAVNDQVDPMKAQLAPQESVLDQVQPQVQPQIQADKIKTLEVPLEPQVNVKAEVAPEAQVSNIVPDTKILETLNREHMFQKLETMKKTEDPLAKAESRNTMDGISKAQPSVQVETSNPSQSTDQGPQDDLHHHEGHQETVQLGTVPQPQSHVAQNFSQVTATAQINKPDVAKDADEANLKEILNQAQYLVTKGGGEVSVKMTPEGMGEVQLKIMMENGKMNLEMNTHDKNVQKLIQDSLSDLKSSLAAHQISVDHVTLNNKISTVYEAQNTQSSQNFTDAHAHHQSQHSHQRDQRQQAGQVLQHETMKALPLAKNEINKASAHRVYQTHKAHSLNAVA